MTQITLPLSSIKIDVQNSVYRYAEQREKDPRLKDMQQLDIVETQDDAYVVKGMDIAIARLRSIMRNYLQQNNTTTDTDYIFKFPDEYIFDKVPVAKFMTEYATRCCVQLWLETFYPQESSTEEAHKSVIESRLLRLLEQKPVFPQNY